MNATEKVQHGLDGLKARIESLDKEAGELKAKFEEKQAEGGRILVDGEDTGQIEDEIFKIGSRLKIVEAGRETVGKLLAEANAKLVTAKKQDAQARVGEIAEEMRAVVAELDPVLVKAHTLAQQFDNLRGEAQGLYETQGASLTKIVAWVNSGPPSYRPLAFVLSKARQQIGTAT